MSKKPPKYTRHSSGQARVRVNGRVIYLGLHGSPESLAEYRRILAELEAGQAPAPKGKAASVAAVLDAYGVHAAGVYSAKQLDRISRAAGIARELYGHTLADDFRLAALETVRGQMLRADFARPYVNALVGCIKRAWRWAGQRRMVSAECVADLDLLGNLREGQLGAAEPPPVEPVEWEHVRRSLRYMLPQVRAMVLLQWFAGMRTQEVLLMRPCDLNLRRNVWLYRPHQHKNKWRGQDRTVYLGPVCQRILRRYIQGRAIDAYMFSPRDAMAGRGGGGRKTLRERYSNETYSRAVARACAKAGVSYHPYQLRHSAASRIAEEYDPETARLVLGQRSLTSTRRYMQDRGGKAAEAMRKSG